MLVFLGLDFAKCFRVGIDWNSHGQHHLHEDQKPLTYSIQVNPKDSLVIYSTGCAKTRLINGSNILLPLRTIVVNPQKDKKYLSFQTNHKNLEMSLQIPLLA